MRVVVDGVCRVIKSHKKSEEKRKNKGHMAHGLHSTQSIHHNFDSNISRPALPLSQKLNILNPFSNLITW